MKKDSSDIYVVVPNYNGAADLPACIDSLLAQTAGCHIVVVDNSSSDSSLDILKNYDDKITILQNETNLGFTGGVNAGLEFAMGSGASYIALFNSDAVAEPEWLENLHKKMLSDPSLGIVTSRITSIDGKYFDSTGDFYTAWGMPFPRGRGASADNNYDKSEVIFGASGCASLYRVKMLDRIGLFDQDFFAYFEDVDLSFRAQLTGWKVVYQPKAVVRHKINATSSKISGFGTFHSFKNLPLLFIKNVPLRLVPGIGLRFFVFYWVTALASLFKDNPLSVIKGVLWAIALTPKKVYQRQAIQKKRSASTEYIRSIITYDLPPDSKKLRKLRKIFTGS